jgi:hypothetical protein
MVTSQAMLDDPKLTPADIATDRLHLGSSARARLSWTFERISNAWRMWLLNNDESGSMEKQIHQNALAFGKVSSLLGDRADVIVVHGFGYDSLYQIFAVPALVPLFKKILSEGGLKGEVVALTGNAQAAPLTRSYLKSRTTHGSTCPGSHPRFLQRLADALDTLDGTVELVVVNTSDGGFDKDTPQKQIQEQMRRITTRCRCKLVANVLVGSNGSPSALHFFTGDPDAFDARLLLSTVAPSQGVLLLADLDAQGLSLADTQGEERMTLQPSTPFWSYHREAEELRVYWPEGAARAADVTLRRYQPQPGGREVIMTARAALEPKPVRIDHDAREMFALISRCFSDNPYLRDESRESLNRMIAPLELLLRTRAELIRKLTARPEETEILQTFSRRLHDNLLHIQATREADLSARERSARINTLNNARRLLKDSLRLAEERIEQDLVERELTFLDGHPNHWAVWLQPALDELHQQLSLTQQDPGSAMQHLSTRIRTKKSREDGQTRAVDRHIEALTARSRARHDAAARVRDPKDDIPLEQPGAWLGRRCPITGAPLTEGLAALPFVTDRTDITSGNVASGGQNVDRLPVERDAILSLKAVRGLMWGPGGQMASPFCTSRGVYNAAIPVLLGPATPAALRDLQNAIGWLCTGTSAFEPAMAEAIPAALGPVLGRLDEGDAPAEGGGGPLATADEQAHALLRTSALLKHMRSYPYVSGTAVLDESAPRQPLPDVWALCLMDSAETACLQNAGCISSVLGRVVVASTFELAPVARGMFSWACRNIARSVLGTTAADGRGGVEGIRRLAALLCHDVELSGYAPSAPAKAAAFGASADDPGGGEGGGGEGRLDQATLATLLGPELSPLWSAPRMPGPHDFVEALNAWISSLPPDQVMYALDRLGGVLERFDAMAARAVLATPLATPLAGSSVASPATASQAVRVERIAHAHFNLLTLESLSPVRLSTPVPGLADENLEMRRVLKFGETTWIPPRDARLPAGEYNPSARRFLNEHTAMVPVRALLRLHAADCLGLARLEALRARRDAPPFPRVDDVLAGLSEVLGGMDEVVLLALRAFAFVVVEANGYADKHWTETPLRAAPLDEVSRVLGLTRADDGARAPVHYGPRALVIPPATEPDWPKMIGKGYLPKSRRVGPDGEPMGPPVRLRREEVGALPDKELCQKGTAAIITGMESEGQVVFPALHREARAVLGAYPRDLRGLPEIELRRVLKEELVPALAGKVKGNPEHPRFFQDCAVILKAMVALGEDTRAFRAEEPEAFLHIEARQLRANAR